MSENRRKGALDIRITAADLAYEREHPTHIANGDEVKFSGDEKYLSSFTKGLPHNYKTGLLKDEKDFRFFSYAIKTGEPIDFLKTPLGPDGDARNPEWKFLSNTTNNTKVRAWESQGAGHAFDLEGPDAQSVTMPPAPKLGSDELIAEMAEVYSQSILRDTPFAAMAQESKYSAEADTAKVKAELGKLNQLAWFGKDKILGLSSDELSRRRGASKGNPINLQNAFRGQTTGDDVGPYISQFLLAGDNGRGNAGNPKDGYINYGSIRIDQRVRTAKKQDYMTTWDEWFDIQNGAKLGQDGIYEDIEKGKPVSSGYRFITTPRDLATYVHNDALYEAYLNACLLLLNNEYKFDSGIPFQDEDYYDHQQGFAHFGGPHILSLVTEVATRALKAVRYQKFNVHRRMRPEVLAARLERHDHEDMPAKGKIELLKMYEALKAAGYFKSDGSLKGVSYPKGSKTKRLLPMAFREGSPMHPSYGAGHATVAGACVTILKAFFDHSALLTLTGDVFGKSAFIPSNEKDELMVIPLDKPLTVEGELNKLASNIAIGRDWAGVHYYTDYIESLRMGENIAIGILEEQKLTYNEEFSMTVPLFDGGTVTI